MFWNFRRFSGANTLAALVSGEAKKRGTPALALLCSDCSIAAADCCQALHYGCSCASTTEGVNVVCVCHVACCLLSPPWGRCCCCSCGAGASARAVEGVSTEQLRDECLEVLRRVHPGKEVPEPTAYTASQWASEPYSRGSYSYVAVGASGLQYDQLAQPVSCHSVPPWLCKPPLRLCLRLSAHCCTCLHVAASLTFLLSCHGV